MTLVPGRPRQSPRHLSRRATLQLLGGGAAIALLSACGTSAAIPPAPTTATQATTPTGTASSTAAVTRAATAGQATTAASGTTTGATSQPMVAASSGSAGLTSTGATGGASTTAPVAIAIPDTGATLPSGPVTYRVTVQGPGPRSPFYKAFFAAYHQAHPNISVTFDELPAGQLNQAISLALQNGDAPDLLWLPSTVTGGQAVQQNWVTPLDPVIPNFSAWKAAFPAGVFIEGITVFNGKTYAFPLTSNQRYSTMLFYSQDRMQKAGYDPAAKPFTWDELRAAAKTLTQQGNGKTYGLILGAKEPDDQFGPFVANLAQMAGTAGGEMNWKTGQYNYTSDEFLAAVQLLLAMKADGSIYPGALSTGQRDATTMLEAGAAAMTLDGPWAPTRWSGAFRYGVASQPVPNSGPALPLNYGPGGGNWHWLYAKSKNLPIGGDIFANWGSVAGQTAFQKIVGANVQAILPAAATAAAADAATQKINALSTQQLRLAPDPRARRADVGQVYVELRTVHPNLGETVQGIYSGQLSDAKKALQALQSSSDAELNRAIKAAQAKGAKVTRDDWVFPNWDPTKDYTDADYQALGG
jgi:multiple sugar transport system substrate-binding protein